MKRIPVKSSNIKSIGFDPEQRELEVEFSSGSVYTYNAVPREVYEALIQENSDVLQGKSDASVGVKFNDLVKKSGYDFGRL